MDIVRRIINDIALAGLEGITLQGLWAMLAEQSPTLLKNDDDDDDMKEFIWRSLIQSSQIEFWFVNQAKKITDKNAKKSKKTTIGNDGDNESIMTKKLPEGWISDDSRNIYGYCPDFELREIITEQVHKECSSPKDAFQKWGDNLYMVGSIELRQSVLFGDENPQNLMVTDCRYIFLELIGKTKHKGLIQADFCNYSMDPRSSFHFIKTLVNLGLVTKQRFCFRRESNAGGFQRLIKTNILFLKHFHTNVLTFHNELEDKIVQELLKAPGQIMVLNELKEKVGISRKLFRSTRDNLLENGNIQILKDGEICNNRTNKDSSATKKSSSSSSLYVQLIDSTLKQNTINEDNDDDDVDEESNYLSKCKHTMPQLVIGIPKLQQMYWLVENAKGKGITLGEFGADACVPFRTARSVIRHLSNRGLVKGVATDKAKQRVARFISNNYIYESKAFKDINAEINRAIELGQAKNVESENKKLQEQDKIKGSKTASKPSVKKAEIDNLNLYQKESEIFIQKGSLINKRIDRGNNFVETPKGKRRQNILLEKIRSLKVVEGANQLYKTVLQSEQASGVKERVCRKSVNRLLERMAASNLIKRFEIVVPYGDGTSATIVYFCDSTISMEDEVFRTVVNETKFRLKGIVDKRQIRTESNQSQKCKPKNTTTITNASLFESVNEASPDHDEQTDTDDEEYEPITGSAYQRPQYGYLPRFPRIKMLHVYLWQLVYGTREDAALCTDSSTSQKIEEEALEFRKEHYGWLPDLFHLPENRLGKGFFQVGDALAVMPLEVFVKCIGICLRSRTIEKLLAHPKKCYTPLRDLPPRLKTKLLRGRSAANYNGHFTESLVLLAHMGLLQVTRDKLPALRAHIAIYVCKEAKLVDTTSSEKGYSKIQLPPNLQSFPEMFFKFKGLRDLSKYWRDLQCICLNTRLGLLRERRKDNGPDGEDEKPEKSQRVSRAMMTLKDIQENYSFDDPATAPPFICGDGLGAAGFDSTFFGHLPKNWSNVEAKKKRLSRLTIQASSTALEQRIPAPLGGFKKRVVNSVVAKASIGGRGKARKRVFDNKVVNEAVPRKRMKNGGHQAENRAEVKQPDYTKLRKMMIARYQQKSAKSNKQGGKEKDRGHQRDEIDRAAVQRKRTMRVRFCQKEDSAILIAQVTAGLLNLDSKFLNYWQVARDIFHKLYPEFCDKTTESLRRRSRNLFKNQLTVQNYNSCVLDCQTDPSFIVKLPNDKDDSWKTAFIDLFPQVLDRFQKRLEMDVLDKDNHPDTLKELKEQYVVTGGPEGKMFDDHDKTPTKKEITLSTVEQLLHNSLIYRNSNDYVPSLVFHVFNQFPETLLDEAMFRMKSKGIITRQRVQIPRRRAVPISTMTFCLSVSYARTFELPLPCDLFQDAGAVMRLIKDGRKHVNIYNRYKTKANEPEKHSEEGEVRNLNEDGDDTKDEINEEKKEGINEEDHSVDESFKILGVEGEDPNLYEEQEQSSTPGIMLYSRENCVGGHVAGILSLLVNEKGCFDMEIPDEMLDIDQSEMNESETEKWSKQGTGMVAFLKRRMYSQNIEDALTSFDNEDDSSNIEVANEDVDGDEDDEDDIYLPDDDDDDDDYDDDGDDVKTCQSKDENASNKKTGELSKISKMDEKISEGESCLKPKQKSCLKTGKNDAENEEENEEGNTVVKKKRKVMFDEPRLELKSYVETCDDFNEEQNNVDHTVSRDGLLTNQNLKRSKLEAIDVNCDVAIKKAKFDDVIKNKSYSGNLNFQLKTSSNNVSFLSDKCYINKYADETAKFSNLTQDFSYIDDVAQSTTKGTMAIVPKQSLEMRKTKLNASRTTLMLHRSLDQESENFQKKLYKSHEQLVLNPMKMWIHLKSKPYCDVDLSMQPQSGGTAGKNDDGNVSDSENKKDEISNKDDEEMITRFMESEQLTNQESELQRTMTSDDVSKFVSFMVQTFNLNENETGFINEVLHLAVKAKVVGITEKQVGDIYMNYLNVMPLEEMMQYLLNFQILFKVGILKYRYVAQGFVADWSFVVPHEMREQRNDNRIAEVNSNKIETEQKKQKDDDEIKREMKIDENRLLTTKQNYRQVVCKPWLKLNGDINAPTLQKFQRSILSAIMTCPGITQSAIYGNFRTILTPVALNDILDFLELEGCISKHVTARRRRPGLFDEILDSMEFEGMEDEAYFVPKIDCILNMML